MQRKKRQKTVAILYTWTPIGKDTGKLFSGNIGIFTSKEQALEWAGFTCDHETDPGSDVFSPDDTVCERLKNKRVNYYLNVIRGL